MDPRKRLIKPISVPDLDNNYTKLSLEETKFKAEEDRELKVANERKAHVREILKHLRNGYAKVLARNIGLLESQMISK